MPFLGEADERSDVWGLGATLYELLTLRRAFDGETTEVIRQKVMTAEPERINALVGNVPADLAAVCRKSMRKGPEKRYATAWEFAEDLRRWLRYEPTKARGAWMWWRMWLWGRRNPGWAAAVAAGMVALLAVVVVGGLHLREEARRARERAEAAEQQQRDLEFAGLLSPIEQLRLGSHQQGWSGSAWTLVKQAAALRIDDSLRAQAAATLAGMDVKELKVLTGEQASSVAFDAKGERLLLGGLDDVPARLWDGSDKPLLRSRYRGPGPVAFATDGSPLQLVVDPENPGRLLLWDISGQILVQAFPLPRGKGPPVLTMTPDGGFIAASSGGRLLVWKTQSDAPALDVASQASALALAQDGSHVAAGEDRKTQVWALASRARVAKLPDARHRISSLAFQRDSLRSGEVGEPTRWLLAAGDMASGLAIWEVTTGVCRTRCLGAKHDIHALAFNPDGTILASGSIGEVLLWDVATGRRILKTGSGYRHPGVAFSPQAGRFACVGSRVFWESDTRVWNLENGRGQRSLRGLAAAISGLASSPDGAYLAALSHNWQVGIWHVPSGELLHVLDVRPGEFADNAGMAFGPENHFVFVSGKDATLWKLGPNKAVVQRSWVLPRGLVDRVAYPSRDRLILWRMEAVRAGNEWGPWQKNPRLLIARNLLATDPFGHLAIVPTFNAGIFDGKATPDGRSFIAAGEVDRIRRSVAAFETAGGKRRWEIATKTKTAPGVSMAPGGDLVAIQLDDGAIVLKSVEDGVEVNRLKGSGCALDSSPDQRMVIYCETEPGKVDLRLIERSGRKRQLTLLVQPSTDLGRCLFDPPSRWFAWGNEDGTVTLCDIDEVFSRLEHAGLGWPTK